MTRILAYVLLAVMAIHAWHVALIEVGSIPPLKSKMPLSWSSLDQIAAASLLGKGFVLGLDALAIAVAVKILVTTKSKRSRPDSDKK